MDFIFTIDWPAQNNIFLKAASVFFRKISICNPFPASWYYHTHFTAWFDLFINLFEMIVQRVFLPFFCNRLDAPVSRLRHHVLRDVRFPIRLLLVLQPLLRTRRHLHRQRPANASARGKRRPQLPQPPRRTRDLRVPVSVADTDADAPAEQLGRHADRLPDHAVPFDLLLRSNALKRTMTCKERKKEIYLCLRKVICDYFKRISTCCFPFLSLSLSFSLSLRIGSIE